MIELNWYMKFFVPKNVEGTLNHALERHVNKKLIKQLL